MMAIGILRSAAMLAVAVFVGELSAAESDGGLEACAARARGTDIRIVSYNILMDGTSGKAPESTRSNDVAHIVSTLAPDVACFQEACPRKWQKMLPVILPRYRFLDIGDTFNRIAYDPGKMEYLTGGIRVYPHSWTQLRNLVWALFVHKPTGRRVIVTNTHWDLSDPLIRERNVCRMAEWIHELSAKHDAMVFSAGDFNTSRSMRAYKRFLGASGFSDVVESASRHLNAGMRSWIDSFPEKLVPQKGEPIDHVFYRSTDADALFRAIVIDRTTLRSSDHFPLVADFQFRCPPTGVTRLGNLSPYGSTAHVTCYHYDDRDWTFDAAWKINDGWIRSMVNWNWSTNDLYLSQMDRLVEGMDAHGISFLPILHYWPRSGERACDRVVEWKKWVRSLAQRYGRRIPVYEVFNEVNGRMPPEEYVRILRATYEAVKEVDPAIRVAISGMSGVPIEYIEDLYELGAAKWFDIMNVHPYQYYNRPEDPGAAYMNLRKLRPVMSRYGDAGKEIWMTETGWPTTLVSEMRQAQYLQRAMMIAFAEGVSKVFWFEFYARERREKDNEEHFGIFHADHSPKPAVNAYHVMTKLRPTGSHQRFDKPWRFDCGRLLCPQWTLPEGVNAGALWSYPVPCERTLKFTSNAITFLTNDGLPATNVVSLGNGSYTLKLGEAPIFFCGGELNVEDSAGMRPIQARHVHHKEGVRLWKGGPIFCDRNLGAAKVSDAGLYFAWGDTAGFKTNSSNWVFSRKRCRKFDVGVGELKRAGLVSVATGCLAPSNDAARQKLGTKWRMPTDKEFQRLLDECDWSWAELDGICGFEVRGRGEFAAKAIFLPLTGEGMSRSFFHGKQIGRYWASTPWPNGYSSHSLYFDCGSKFVDAPHRWDGFCIRAVRD